jgi:transposase-like protein
MAKNKYRKRFDDDYKRKIVQLVDELGKSPTQVAQDIGTTPANY